MFLEHNLFLKQVINLSKKESNMTSNLENNFLFLRAENYL